MNVTKSLEKILFTLLSDAEARNFEPPVPAEVVAELDALIKHFSAGDEYRMLFGEEHQIIRIPVNYRELSPSNVNKIGWIKQFRMSFRVSLKSAHDLSILRDSEQDLPFNEFLLMHSSPAPTHLIEQFRMQEAENAELQAARANQGFN